MFIVSTVRQESFKIIMKIIMWDFNHIYKCSNETQSRLILQREGESVYYYVNDNHCRQDKKTSYLIKIQVTLFITIYLLNFHIFTCIYTTKVCGKHVNVLNEYLYIRVIFLVSVRSRSDSTYASSVYVHWLHVLPKLGLKWLSSQS